MVSPYSCVKSVSDLEYLKNSAIVSLLGGKGSTIYTRLTECGDCAWTKACSLTSTNMSMIFNTTSETEIQIQLPDSVNFSKSFYFEHGAAYEFNLQNHIIKTTTPAFDKTSAILCISAFIVFWFACDLCEWIRIFLATHHTSTYNGRILLRRNEEPEAATESTSEDRSKNRSRSVDINKGITISLMIFVNYGGGGFASFEHATWNGLTVADIVFPNFVFLMGISLGIVTIHKGRSIDLLTAAKRTVYMILIGIFIINGGKSWCALRYLGVLQRLALSYFIFVCILKLAAFLRKPVADPETEGPVLWSSLLITCLAVTSLQCLWIAVNFFKVPGCPSFYMGPGGLSEKGQFADCTGGITTLIDRTIFGSTHLYSRPTCRNVYSCMTEFDPENLLGVLPTVFNVFAGYQISFLQKKFSENRGRFYKISALLSVGYAALGIMTMTQIPIIKNLWTISFALVTSSISIIVQLIVHYLTEDRKLFFEIFKYGGENALLAYVIQAVAGKILPLNWNTDQSYYQETWKAIMAVTFVMFCCYLLKRSNIRFAL